MNCEQPELNLSPASAALEFACKSAPTSSATFSSEDGLNQRSPEAVLMHTRAHAGERHLIPFLARFCTFAILTKAQHGIEPRIASRDTYGLGASHLNTMVSAADIITYIGVPLAILGKRR